MKKNYLNYALMALALPLAIACDEENKVVPFNPDTTAPNGILVLNSGNQGKAIDGSLHFIKDNTVTNDVFKGVNQTSLGGTPNDMIVYGSKIYIVSTLENTVFVLDKNTRKLLQRVSTTDLMGKSEGQSPRQLAAGDGQVFVSAYSTGGSTPYSADLRGHVAAFDTINFVKTNSVEVGSYPEGLDYYKGKLYVANSGYSKGNSNVMIVNWMTGEKETFTNENLENTQQVVVVEDGYYVLDWGHYNKTNWAQEGTGLFFVSAKDNQVSKVAEATKIDVQTYDLAGKRQANMTLLSAPYLGKVSYGFYQTATKELRELNGIQVDAPSAIAMDKATGNIYVASLPMGEYGYADYSGISYVVVYDKDGKQVNRFNVGNGQIVKFARVY
ncbi:MAG: hypothetical protein SPF56_00665 [Bacteroidaceae bacterium]|nr:hypothetical protein [Prevotellaceae bacterium]MDY5631014.1 hypothetical protein [Bacteroidaceae bacterium]